MKQKGVVGKDGKIEIQTSELAEGTIVEVIVLIEQPSLDTENSASIIDAASQDTTAYLLSTEANRRHLMASIEQATERKNLVSFTPEEYNVHS